MKRSIKILLCFLLFLFGTVTVYATDDIKLSEDEIKNAPSKNIEYKDYDYVIDKYNIQLVVNDDNSYDITETITAYFNKEKHGIFRTIPLNNNVGRLNGLFSYNNAEIDNLQVNEKHSKSIINNEFKIKIGDQYKTITGYKTYVIKYKYSIGIDPLMNKDEFYFNLIGTDWDTAIGNVTFSITMPKEFDSKKLGFSSGVYGSIDNKNIKYSIDGKIITGKYNGILNKNEGISVRCELPKRYFSKIKFVFSKNIEDYKSIIVMFGLLMFTFILWLLLGLERKGVEPVEFYPPDGLNSFDVGCYYNGKPTSKAIASLIVYLASKGYIQIIDNQRGFTLKKIKDYDGEDNNEKWLMSGIFSFGKTETTSYNMQNDFEMTGEKIMYHANENKNDILVNVKPLKIFLFILLVFCYLHLLSPITNGRNGLGVWTIILTFIGIYLICAALFSNVKKIKKLLSIISGIALIILGFILSYGWFLLFPNDLLSYIVGIPCVMGIMLLLKSFKKRTKNGSEMLKRIKGFRNFLQVAEKEQLEGLVLENPSYFYDILPYAYVLDVSDKWIKKFEVVEIPNYDFFLSSSEFKFDYLFDFINATSVTVRDKSSNYGLSTGFANFAGSVLGTIITASADGISSRSSYDSSRSSGGSSSSGSGGGFSGGGSGGGGGSSW